MTETARTMGFDGIEPARRAPITHLLGALVRVADAIMYAGFLNVLVLLFTLAGGVLLGWAPAWPRPRRVRADGCGATASRSFARSYEAGHRGWCTRICCSRHPPWRSPPPDEQEAELGAALTGTNLEQAHSRLAAYAADRLGDDTLADRAWRACFRGGEFMDDEAFRAVRITPPYVLAPVDEVRTLSTNDAAQCGLATIQNLALIGHRLGATT